MEKNYTYPPYIRSLGKLLIFLALVVLGILIVAAIADSSFSFDMLGFAALFAAVFITVGWLMVRTHSVVITLSKDGIEIVSKNRKRVVLYDQINAISHKTKMFSVLVLDTAQGKLTVGKTLTDYPDFVEMLKARIPVMRQEQTDTLSFRCRAWEMYVSAGIFWVLSFGFVVIAVIASITGDIDVGSCVFISVVLLPFIIGLSWGILKTPRRYVFEPGSITKISLSGTKIFSPENIKSVEYGQKKPKTQSRFGSPVLHFIDIRFERIKAYVWVDQTMTDFPIDDIKGYVISRYPVEGRFTEVTLTTPPKAS
jgi:hypothetical protein